MIELPEIIPIPEVPEPKKNLTPAAIKPTGPALFDPERDGREDLPERKRNRSKRFIDANDPEDSSPARSTDPSRGTRVDIRA